MLVKIREKSRGIVAYFIVGLIALAFSMWGMDSLFTAMRGDPNEVARVNGESLSHHQVDRLAQQQLRQLVQGGQIDPERIDMNQLRSFALSQLIQEELLRQKTSQLRMTITDQQLDQQLVQIDAFHNERGRFDREIYTQMLRQQGMTPSEFRAQLREDLLYQQLMLGLSASEFVLDQELNNFQRLVGQQRSYRFIYLNPNDFIAQVEVSDDDIEAFYQAEAERFMQPQRIRVDYLIFDPAQLASEFDVSEDELQQEYQRFARSHEGATAYSAAHILLSFNNANQRAEVRRQLEDAKNQILQGASFAELARELSEDTLTARRGGELGVVDAGTLDPAFEQALFDLEAVGDLAIAETSFGLHLIQLTDLDEGQVPTFEQVREDLRERLIAQPLRAATSDRLEELSNLSFSSEHIREVAEQVNLPLNTSDWLVSGRLEGVWAEAPVRQALFSAEVIEDGWMTEPLRLEDGRYLVLARQEHQPRQSLPLAEVAEQVRTELQWVEAQRLAQREAERLEQQLQEKGDLDLDWLQVSQQTRHSRSVDPEVNRAAFAIARDTQARTRHLTLANGQLALIQLQEVREGEVSRDPNERRQLRQMLAEDKGYRIQSGFIEQLERQADIQLN